MQRMILLAFLAAMLFCGTAGGQEKEKLPQLTVATRRYDGSDLITLDAKGENVARLTKDLGDISEPAWHPEGGRLAFVVTANDAGSLKILDVNSGQLASVGGGHCCASRSACSSCLAWRAPVRCSPSPIAG